MARLIVKKDGQAEFRKALDELIKSRVYVGITADSAVREPTEGDPRPTLNNAEIGYIMENGAPEANIPARPWLAPGVESAKADIANRYRRGVSAVLLGKTASAEQLHHSVGFIAQAAVQKKIQEGPFQPLAESTLAKREARGVTRDKPLIDTGGLVQAVRYVIKPARNQGG